MNNFDVLEKEILDLCSDNRVEFSWTDYDHIDARRFKFMKLNKELIVVISRKDLYIRKFDTIKAQLESAIFELLKETK